MRDEIGCTLNTGLGPDTRGRLSRILGHALAELHTLRTMSPHERDACVQRLDMELVDWLRETPPFFHPRTEAGFETDGFVQIPEFFLRSALHRVLRWPLTARVVAHNSSLQAAAE